jgi:hypothetical protein
MSNNFKAFMLSEMHAIDIAKWLEGCEHNYDPGENFVLKWIEENAKDYREKWFASVCCTCDKSEDCGYRCLTECEYYNENEIKEENNE